MAAVFLPGGKAVATGGPPGEICVWSTADGRLIRRLASSGACVATVAWSPDGQTIAWGTEGWHSNGTGPLERTFCLPKLDFGPSPTANFVRSQADVGELHIQRSRFRNVDVSRNGSPISTIEIPNIDDSVRCRTLIPGERVVVGCTYGLFVYDAASGRPIYNLPGHTDTVWAVAPSPNGRYILSGGGDDTLEIWNVENYQLVLSLFFAGDEWIAWTPQGYYATSLGGEGLMGWHLNRGPERMAAFYPAASYHNALYRPDVIRRIIAAGTPQAALYEADAARDRDQRPQTIRRRLSARQTLKFRNLRCRRSTVASIHTYHQE